MLFSIYLSTGTSKLNFMRGYLPFGLSLDKSITVHLALGWYNEEDCNDNFATTDNWLQYLNNYQLLALTVDLARDHFPWAVFSIRLGTNLIIRQICIKPAYHTLSLIGHGWYLRSELSYSDCQYTNSDLQVFHRFNSWEKREHVFTASLTVFLVLATGAAFPLLNRLLTRDWREGTGISGLSS
jgi:hypothetical protein